MIILGNERLKRSQLLEKLLDITDQARILDSNRPTLGGVIDVNESITVGALLSVLEELVVELHHLTKVHSVLAVRAQDLLFDAMALPSCHLAQAFLEPKLKRNYLVAMCVKLITWLEDLNDSYLATERVFHETTEQLRKEYSHAIVAVA